MILAGMDFATDQFIVLFAFGVIHINVYSMNNPDERGLIKLPISFLFMENHLIGFNTSIRVIFHCMAGFQNIESKIARAADGVIIS